MSPTARVLRHAKPLVRASTPRKRPLSDDAHYRLQRLGAVLRDARRAAGLSLEELAEQSEVSAALISQIERANGNPSFVTLLKLRTALALPWDAIFQGRRDRQMLVRTRERQRLRLPGERLALELLTPSFDGPYLMFQLTYPPGYNIGAVRRREQGEQSIHVLRGRLSVTVGKETHDLRAGDTVTLPTSVPHATRNPGRISCDVIVVRSQVGLGA